MTEQPIKPPCEDLGCPAPCDDTHPFHAEYLEAFLASHGANA